RPTLAFHSSVGQHPSTSWQESSLTEVRRGPVRCVHFFFCRPHPPPRLCVGWGANQNLIFRGGWCSWFFAVLASLRGQVRDRLHSLPHRLLESPSPELTQV